MKLDLNAGAGIAAELGSKLDRIAGGIDRLDLQNYPQRAIHVQGSIVGVGSQNAFTTIPGPEGGKEWHLRRLTFAPQIGTAVGTAGTIVVGLSAGVLTSAQGSGQLVGGQSMIEVCRNPQSGGTGGAPCYFTFSHSQVVIRPPLNIVCAWLSGTDTVPLVIDGEVEEVLLGMDPDR